MNQMRENAAVRTRNVTHLQYYAHRLAIRSGFSPIHSSRKLFLMYCLDAFMTVEGNRLEYYRCNQSTIRAEHYQGLVDHLTLTGRPNNQTPTEEGIMSNQQHQQQQVDQQQLQVDPIIENGQNIGRRIFCHQLISAV